MRKIIIVFSMLLFSSVILNAQEQKDENPNAAQIKFETLIHDYGKILKDSDGKFKFVFTNTGKEPLILSQPRSSCGCTVPTWPKKPILPGKSDEIEVTYATNRVGPFAKTVTIMSNAKTPVVVLKIQGEVVDKLVDGTPSKNSGSAPTNK
ncbi:MAG: hypothetical protein CVU00_03825 [Bacteroidetes bacterium HGW-Bacteroidetes-17]|jgi:hypothetical protein|nr:MAG: hypothetical protein CVU00_03825 [Bacteroidetes bacterium HGW-Bacteroidetes-17]